MRGDPEIVVADDLAVLLQFGSDLSVVLCGGLGQGCKRDALGQCLDTAQCAFAHLAFFRTKTQSPSVITDMANSLAVGRAIVRVPRAGCAWQ